MLNNTLSFGLVDPPSMLARLRDQVQEGARELRENPRLYVTSALRSDSGGSRRTMLLQTGFAMAILFYAIAFATMLIFWSISPHRSQIASDTWRQTLVLTTLPHPKVEIAADDGTAGGGGGGGRHTITLPSAGDLPLQTLAELIIVPRPQQQLTPPALPMIEKIMVDPRIQLKHDDLGRTGLPDGAGLVPSEGPGSDGGIGTGSRSGIGVGDGPGFDQGAGGNTNGGPKQIGGNSKHPASQAAVDQRPILLNQPRPLFTEEARQHKIQGVVRVRILVDAKGRVAEVVVTRGLPDGLNEQAILAAYQMRFTPAMRNGQPVSYWLSNVEVEFNLR